MTVVPPSSFASGSVTVVGTVSADVTDRVGRLLGHTTVDNVSLAVTGPLTDAQLAARLPLGVTGPLTDAQLAARLPLSVAGPVTQGTSPWVVDGSGVTQPVSGPLTAADLTAAGLATEDTLADAVGALNDVALTAILERDRMATE